MLNAFITTPGFQVHILPAIFAILYKKTFQKLPKPVPNAYILPHL